MLVNGIHISGTKIEIVDAGQSLLPKSQGYVVGVASAGKSNGLVMQSILVTRRGKSGQPRMELKKIFTPVFYLDSTPAKTEEYYNALGQIGKYYVRYDVVDQPVNLLELPTVEFLAWGAAKIMNLIGIQRNHADIKAQFIQVQQGSLFDNFKRMPGSFDRVLQNVPTYENTDNRIELINAIRQGQSKLFRCSLSAERSKAAIRRHAASWLRQAKQAKKYKFSSIKELKALEKS